MRPAIADVAQLAYERPLRLAQLALEDLLPVEPDGAEHRLWIGQWIALVRAVGTEVGDLRPLLPVDRLQLPLDERLQAIAKLLDRLAHAFLVGQSHVTLGTYRSPYK